MKLLPKRTLIAATLAAAFVGLSAAAIAQGTAQAPASPPTAQAATPEAPSQAHMQKRSQRHAERMERMQKKMAARQAQLKSELKLTAEQEPAWNAFVARTQPLAHPAPRGPREDWSKLTTPERLDKMQAIKTERDARMAQRTEAIKSFYAALNADQKKVFDEKYGMGMQRTGLHHKGHHGGHHPMGGMHS
ncbi:MAG: Spy/CpxP family protein refolding chaperone [Hydrogenophaga sp.]|uniref:Spy/CpxP family protein refolding chaperone n=1 Tax=Hydrogenophaga sp. TaxID=1904254 RepID=UPI003D0EFAEE